MLFIVRIILFFIFFIIVCTIGSIYCLFDFRNPRNVAIFSQIFGRFASLFGLKIETRISKEIETCGNAIYISNHQNSYDIVTVSNIVQPFTVTVGKKSLIWIPFFGQLYWLTGNLLINRNHCTKAYGELKKIIDLFKKRRISIWIFPEGTRSYGRGLLPFKTGAFYIAIAAGVPIIPVCVSNTSKKINLNRLNNGLVIIEMLPPLDTSKYRKEQVRELAIYCHELMIRKINDLNKEVKERESSGSN